MKKLGSAFLFALLILATMPSVAEAQGWKAPRPGGRWVMAPGWPKQGVQWLEGQWQYECSVAHPDPRYSLANKRRYLAIWAANPGWSYVECYFDNDVERRIPAHTNALGQRPGMPPYQIDCSRPPYDRLCRR